MQDDDVSIFISILVETAHPDFKKIPRDMLTIWKKWGSIHESHIKWIIDALRKNSTLRGMLKDGELEIPSLIEEDIKAYKDAQRDMQAHTCIARSLPAPQIAASAQQAPEVDPAEIFVRDIVGQMLSEQPSAFQSENDKAAQQLNVEVTAVAVLINQLDVTVGQLCNLNRNIEMGRFGGVREDQASKLLSCLERQRDNLLLLIEHAQGHDILMAKLTSGGN